jgi:hypothetical protein
MAAGGGKEAEGALAGAEEGTGPAGEEVAAGPAASPLCRRSLVRKIFAAERIECRDNACNVRSASAGAKPKAQRMWREAQRFCPVAPTTIVMM